MAGAALFAACGCATTVETFATDDDRRAGEKIALAQAASAIEPEGWARASLKDGPLSLVTDRSADRTARRYAATLGEGEPALAILMSDAEQALGAAARFIETVETTFDGEGTAASPSMDDVALLEDAIQSMRFQRTVFLASVDLLAAEEAAKKIASVSIRGRFDATTIRLSSLADEVAASALEAKFSEAGVAPLRPRTARVSGDE